MGAGVPAFEQRGHPMRARKGHVSRLRRAVARDVLVTEALGAQYAEHSGTVGADHRTRFGGRSREIDELCRAWGVRDTEADTTQSEFPINLCPNISTAIITGTLSVEAPRRPVARPPTKDSSTSTTPANNSRSGRTIARRSLCSHAHAVS